MIIHKPHVSENINCDNDLEFAELCANPQLIDQLEASLKKSQFELNELCNSKGDSPLAIAAKRNNIGAVHLLLAHGANITESRLGIAKGKKSISILQFLDNEQHLNLKKRLNPDIVNLLYDSTVKEENHIVSAV